MYLYMKSMLKAHTTGVEPHLSDRILLPLPHPFQSREGERVNERM
jgi:hypothetical protein